MDRPRSPRPPLKTPVQRRDFVEWLLHRCALIKLPSARLRTRLIAAVMNLAMAWSLPADLVRTLYAVALYSAWADQEAEMALSSVKLSDNISSLPESGNAMANNAASIFCVLAARMCFLDDSLSGRVLTDASEGSRSVLACLREVG